MKKTSLSFSLKNRTLISSALCLMLTIANQNAFAESPYVSEMPDAIGKGAHELEYSVDYIRPRHRPAGVEEISITQHNLGYTYGATANTDIAINLPFDTLYFKLRNPSFAKIDDTRVQDLQLVAKHRYYQTEVAEMAAKLTLSLPTGDEEKINNARSYGKANVELNLANRIKVLPNLALHNNLALGTTNRKGQKNSSVAAATLGAAYDITPKATAVVDAGYLFNTRDSDINARFISLGGQYQSSVGKISAGFKINRQGGDIEHAYTLSVQGNF